MSKLYKIITYNNQFTIFNIWFKLLSVPPGEASRLDPDDDQFYDYTDKGMLNKFIHQIYFSKFTCCDY